MTNVIGFDEFRIRPMLEKSLQLFLGDPPDSEFQYGYLAATIAMYREGLNRPASDPLLVEAERLLDLLGGAP